MLREIQALDKTQWGLLKLPGLPDTHCYSCTLVDGYGNETSLNICKVDRLVTEHFSIQGRPDPRGMLCCFWCTNKTLKLSLCASDILTIVNMKTD